MSHPISFSNVTGFVAVNSPDFVQAVFEAMASGQVVTFLRSADDEERCQLAQVAEVVAPADGHGWFSPRWKSAEPEKLALITFTSGTEGKAKGVALRHRALDDVVQRLQETMKLDGSVREYVGVPVFYSFGFGRCRAIAAVGGQAYLPPDGFNPIELAEMLGRGEVNAVSAVPSLWRMVLDAKDDFAKVGRAVRWIEIGSQYMSRAEKEELKALFPAATIVQHYGLTEASRATLLRIDTAVPEEIESVGQAIGRIEVEISGEGQIRIRGPNVTDAVLTEGVWTDPRDADGWLTTADRGQLRGTALFFEGRADDLINCGGLKLSPERLEEGVRRRTGFTGEFAVARIADRIRGEGILLACTPETIGQADTLLEALLAEAEAVGVSARSATRVFEVESLPRTSTGKLIRRGLPGGSAKEKELQPLPRRAAAPVSRSGVANLSEHEAELLEIWRQALGTNDIGLDESFYDLGGDSVSALSVVVRMSRAGIDMKICRRIFQGASIRDLARARSSEALGRDDVGRHAAVAGTGREEYLSTLMINVLRGVLVASVVLGHWSLGAWERLPAAFSFLAPLMAPFFSFGTPGFAIAFGTGFGYLYLAKFSDNPARLSRVVKVGTGVVGAGVVLFATMRLIVAEEALTSSNFFEAFYSALTFYLLALPTMPLWFRLLSRFPESRRVVASLAFAVVCQIIGSVLRDVIGPQQPDGFLRLARLMLVAKYNYFTMMGGVLLGVAVGTATRSYDRSPAFSRKVALVGLCTILGAVTAGAALGQAHYLGTWPSPLTSWKWAFFLGVVLLILAVLFRLKRNYADLPTWFRRVLEGLATVGQLALPFYVFHETIMPLKGILFKAGLPDGMSTGLAVVTFLVGSWLMVRRVLRFFHSG